ncbi:hypothetical protein Cgig2_016428 [Carnegiea gigantea]|uniref:Uncharacterized protein n=1 Tax=Carnegiea gigantea TaxID=171969 RepID=A0A9Q1K2I7_9CARY|nr:hypothetical protein Cgig2_016428 [Carnegiea gigantea]
MVSKSTDVDGSATNEACADHSLGSFVESVTNPKGDPQRAPKSERTASRNMEDVSCRGDGVGKSSNFVTCMKRRPRCRKSVAVHGTPCTDPTQLPGVRKDMTERMPIKGSALRPTVEDLNNLKLTKQVLTDYITLSLLITELELLNNVRSRYKGVTPNSKLLQGAPDIMGQGGGPEGEHAKASAYQLVMRPHHYGSKG